MIAEPKAIRQAREQGKAVTVVTYKAQGVKLKRKGYDITDPSTGKTTVIQPKSYPKGSIYESDKWMIGKDGEGLKYVKRIMISMI